MTDYTQIAHQISSTSGVPLLPASADHIRALMDLGAPESLIMTNVLNQVRIAKSWLASFLLREWRPEHYPMEVREQVGIPEEARWCAQVLNWPGPVGLGPTKDAARASLRANLRTIATRRGADGKVMPRPGTGLPIEFASTARVNSDPDLLEEFIVKALGFGPNDPVFISDESSMGDFGDDERMVEIRRNIREHFGVAVDELEAVTVADVLDRIRKWREA